MDFSRFQLSIPYVTLCSDDGVIHKYCIKLVYGKLEWEICRRFSEFQTLNDTLLTTGQFQAIPKPPPKNFLRPRNVEIIEERRIMLENWLKYLSNRPDVRTSSFFLDFIEFESNTNTVVEPLGPVLLGCCDDGKFQLSDFIYCSSNRSIIASYAESANMSRIGKVWSLIELEELGGLSIFELCRSISCSKSTPTTTPTLPLLSYNKKETVQFEKNVFMTAPFRFNRLYYSRSNNRLFITLHNGVVHVYKLPSTFRNTNADVDSTTLHGFFKETELVLHTESIVSINGDNNIPGRFVTAGYDDAIRIVNCKTLETVSGGSLSKRLDYNEKITLAIIENVPHELYNQSRLFIGTAKGNVLICSLHVNPPEYRLTIPCGDSIGALELAGSNILIAHKHILSIYRIGVFGEEHNFSLIVQLNPHLLSGRTINSIAVSISSPLLFMGHTRAITVWDCHEKVCVAAFKAHHGGVRRLCFIGSPSLIQLASDPIAEKDYGLLLSSGGDNTIKLWRFRPACEYRFSAPQPSSLSHVSKTSMPTNTYDTNKPSSQNPTNLSNQINQHTECQASLKNTYYPKLPYNSHNTAERNVNNQEDDCAVLPSDFTNSAPHRH